MAAASKGGASIQAGFDSGGPDHAAELAAIVSAAEDCHSFSSPAAPQEPPAACSTPAPARTAARAGGEQDQPPVLGSADWHAAGRHGSSTAQACPPLTWRRPGPHMSSDQDLSKSSASASKTKKGQS